jgi:hypothetical protein
LIATIGGLGATMGAAVGSALPVIGTAAGGTSGTAAGGYVGELLYQATPTLIDKLFPPGTPNRENPNPDYPDYNNGGGNGDDNDGDGGGSGTGTLLLVGGLAVGLFLILNKK